MSRRGSGPAVDQSGRGDPPDDVARDLRAPRRLPWWGFVVFLIVWFVASAATGAAVSVEVPPGVEGIGSVDVAVRNFVVTDAVGALIAMAFVLYWRRWRAVWFDDRPLRSWVWVVPAAATIWFLARADWADMPDAGPALVLAALAGTVVVGLNEELVTRGIVLVALRDRCPEWLAALLSIVFFGALHLLNGGASVPQAVLGLAAGFLFYLARRISRGLLVPIALHALVDWSLITHALGSRADRMAGDFSDVLFEFGLALAALSLGHFLARGSLIRRRKAAETG